MVDLVLWSLSHQSTNSYVFTSSMLYEKLQLLWRKQVLLLLGLLLTITNHQHCCKQFTLLSDCTAVHPFDKKQVWYLLFDIVHLLKCIRNNWNTEKYQPLSLDGEIVGSFSDVRKLYESEEDSILKATPLTWSAVYPSRLQLQNATHVLHVLVQRLQPHFDFTEVQRWQISCNRCQSGGLLWMLLAKLRH